MMTDQDDLTELHEMARQIGLQRNWFQDKKTHPHYDLRPSKREMAIAAGAVPVSAFEMVGRCSLIFKGNTTP